jgi:hypothetical protein
MRRYSLIIGILIAGLTASVPAVFADDTTDTDGTIQKHLTLDEIIVIGDSVTESQNTEVGAKQIEKGKDMNIPDVLRFEPDIDIKRNTAPSGERPRF